MLIELKGGLLLLEYFKDNYEILLIDKIDFKTGLIYVLNDKKKKILREYVDKNLK